MSDMTSATSDSGTVFKALSRARRRKVRAEYVTDLQEDVVGHRIASAARPHPRVAMPPTDRAGCQTAAAPVNTPSAAAAGTKRFP
jgi:hypothetical protein